MNDARISNAPEYGSSRLGARDPNLPLVTGLDRYLFFTTLPVKSSSLRECNQMTMAAINLPPTRRIPSWETQTNPEKPPATSQNTFAQKSTEAGGILSFCSAT